MSNIKNIILLGSFASLSSIFGFIISLNSEFGWVLATIVVLSIGIIFYWIGSLNYFKSPFLSFTTLYELVLTDTTGSEVIAKKRQDIIPMDRHITRYSEKAFSEYDVQVLSINLINYQSSYSEIREGNTSTFQHEFQNPLSLSRKYTRIFELKYINSYCSKNEFHEIDVNYPGFNLQVTFKFSEDRYPNSIKVFEKNGNISRELGNLEPETSDSERHFSYKNLFPRLGRKFRFEWVW